MKLSKHNKIVCLYKFYNTKGFSGIISIQYDGFSFNLTLDAIDLYPFTIKASLPISIDNMIVSYSRVNTLVNRLSRIYNLGKATSINYAKNFGFLSLHNNISTINLNEHKFDIDNLKIFSTIDDVTSTNSINCAKQIHGDSARY
tara:strand:+ start:624 stop:1055 length:432 start_codon:yes stop_codon:yes gene_type:complete